MIRRATIRKIAKEIARHFRPRRIVLFGSYARGDATENSDLDLLVVVRRCGPAGRRSAPIIEMLAREYALPIDVVVRPEKAVRCWRNVPGSFLHRVLAEGVVLYEPKA